MDFVNDLSIFTTINEFDLSVLCLQDVKVIEHDDMVWVMIVEKQLTRRKGVKSKTPVFLCYEINTPCFFITSSSRLQVDVLEVSVKVVL